MKPLLRFLRALRECPGIHHTDQSTGEVFSAQLEVLIDAESRPAPVQSPSRPRLGLQVISHDAQRYDTVGDYFSVGGIVNFRVSDLGDPRMEMAVFLHELIEYTLCMDRGISIEEIDLFDFAYQGEGEPGNNPRCPYRREHQFAEAMERLFVGELGIDWAVYCAAIDKLNGSKGHA